jgi:hypothetical protein
MKIVRMKFFYGFKPYITWKKHIKTIYWLWWYFEIKWDTKKF